MFKKLLPIFVITFLLLTSCASKVSVQVDYDSSKGVVLGSGKYEIGEEVELEATSKEGYKFTEWLDGEQKISSDQTLSFTIEKSRKLKAQFKEEEYTVRIHTNSDDAGDISGSGAYEYGEEVTVKAVSTDAFEFIRFTENNEELTSNSTYTFNIKKDRNITAEFKLKDDYVKVDIRKIPDESQFESEFYKTGAKIQYDNSGYYAYLQFESDEIDKKTFDYDGEIEVKQTMKVFILSYDSFSRFNKVILSKDKNLLLSYGNKNIFVHKAISLDKVLEINLEEKKSISKLDWVDNSSFLYLSDGELILVDLQGNQEILQNNFIHYNFGSRAFSPKNEDISHAINRITGVNPKSGKINVTVETYNLKEKVSTVTFPGTGETYGSTLPLYSPDYKYGALRGFYSNLYVYKSDTKDLNKLDYLGTCYPEIWRDNKNLIINQTSFDPEAPTDHELILSNYRVSDKKLINIINKVGNHFKISPNNKGIIYTSYPREYDSKNDRYLIKNTPEIWFSIIDYDNVIPVDKNQDNLKGYELNAGIDYSEKYKTEDIKLMDGVQSDVYWIDNNSLVFIAKEHHDSKNMTYMYNYRTDELIEIPINAEKLIGVSQNTLIYLNSEEIAIDNVKHFDLDTLQ